METEILEQLKDIKESLGIVMTLVKKRYFKQNEILKMYGIGHATLRKWVSEGVHESVDGKNIYYDIEEIDAYLDSKKI